eukprot:gene27226-2480_t
MNPDISLESIEFPMGRQRPAPLQREKIIFQLQELEQFQQRIKIRRAELRQLLQQTHGPSHQSGKHGVPSMSNLGDPSNQGGSSLAGRIPRSVSEPGVVPSMSNPGNPSYQGGDATAELLPTFSSSLAGCIHGRSRSILEPGVASMRNPGNPSHQGGGASAELLPTFTGILAGRPRSVLEPGITSMINHGNALLGPVPDPMMHGPCMKLDNTAASPDVLSHHHEGKDPKPSMLPCQEVDKAATFLDVFPHHHGGMEPKANMLPVKSMQATKSDYIDDGASEIALRHSFSLPAADKSCLHELRGLFDSNHTAGSAEALSEQSKQFMLQMQLPKRLECQKQQSVLPLSKQYPPDSPSQNDWAHSRVTWTQKEQAGNCSCLIDLKTALGWKPPP